MFDQSGYNLEQLNLLEVFRSRRTGEIKKGGVIGQYKRQGTDKRAHPRFEIGSKTSINHLDNATYGFELLSKNNIAGNSTGCPDCGHTCHCRIGTGFEKKYSQFSFRSQSPNYPQTLVLA